jgi:hypothetical protein
LGYESEDRSVEPISDGSSTPSAFLMVAPATTQNPPPNPDTGHNKNNNNNNNDDVNGGLPEDVLWIPIAKDVMAENLEAICLSLQDEQERQLV